MSESDQQAYRRPPDQIDMEREERAIRSAGSVATVACVAAGAAGYWGLGAVVEFPVALVERIGFGLVASIFVSWWVLVGVMMVSTHRRESPEDIGGSAAGPPGDELAVKVAFLDNTVEQTLLAVGAIMGWVVLVEGAWLALVVVSVVLFGVGRVLFYRGYPEGASGRALGMTLTMLPTVFGYVAITVLAVVEVVALV